MKSIKRIVAVLLAVLMAVTFCACKGSENGSTDPDKKDGPDDSKNVKIGVLVSDVTSAEALAFRAYYEEYIQKQYNVTFMYSDELADAAAEASAIDNFIANNCKAIISFASADRPAQIEQCEQNGVYYAVATGTLIWIRASRSSACSAARPLITPRCTFTVRQACSSPCARPAKAPTSAPVISAA